MASERPNRGWVRFLTILVGILTVLAILSAWVDRQLFDTQEWGDTSLKMLQNPEIQKQVAEYAVNELYDNVDVDAELEDILPKDLKPLSGVAAGGLRQVADQGARQALSNQRVQDLWRQANETAHSTLVSIIEDDNTVISTTDGQVRLELRPLIIEIASQVGLGEQARSNVPENVGQIEIVDSDELSTVQTAATLIHGTALITALLLLVLLGLAVYLSRGYRWLTLLWLAASLAIGAIVVLILRSAAGGILVPELATVDVQPAAEAAYSIATDLLKSIAWTVIWSAIVLVFLAWLVSPSKAAESTRRFLAVPFGRYPAATFSLFGLVALVFLLMGTGDQREFLVRLMIIFLAAIGSYFFRRELVEAYPDANFAALSDFGHRMKEKAGEAWDNRPRNLPGRQSSDGDPEAANSPLAGPAEAGPGAERAEAGDPAAAETEVLPKAPAVDPETTRLDQLDRLASMHERGVLTDEEFAEEKRRLRDSGG